MARRRRPAWQWVLVALAAVVVAYMGALVWSELTAFPREQRNAQQALANQQATASRAASRITQLSDEIGGLEATASQDAGRISQLLEEVQALERQVKALGAEPVVIESGPALPTPARSSTSSTSSTRPPPASRSTTTSTTRPNAPPSPPCLTVVVVRLCPR